MGARLDLDPDFFKPCACLVARVGPVRLVPLLDEPGVDVGPALLLRESVEDFMPRAEDAGTGAGDEADVLRCAGRECDFFFGPEDADTTSTRVLWARL